MNKLKYDITDIAENSLRGEATVEEIIFLKEEPPDLVFYCCDKTL